MRINPFVVTVVTFALSNFAQASDQGVNAVYERMQAAYGSLDASKLETVYAPDATYLPRSAKANVNTREALRRGLAGFIDQVRAGKGTIRVRFRVV